jgi:hypothetical protein
VLTDLPPDFQIAAEREFERTDDGSLVRLVLGRPEPDPAPGGDWRCRVWLVGRGIAVDQYAYGVDSLQALGLALEMARALLRPGEVTWLRQADLGLPRSLPGVGG